MKSKLNHHILSYWRSTLSEDVIINENHEAIKVKNRILSPRSGNKFNEFKGNCYLVRLINGDLFITNDLIRKGIVPKELREEFPCNLVSMESMPVHERVV